MVLTILAPVAFLLFLLAMERVEARLFPPVEPAPVGHRDAPGEEPPLPAAAAGAVVVPAAS